MILCDLDDFCDDDRSMADLVRLEEIKRRIPTFKATLFTIPGRCSPEFIANMQRDYPWLDLVQHGWNHDSNYECLKWTVEDCREFLFCARLLGLKTRGFKAPGWQISYGCYEALLAEGYWVADQPYNDERRPKELRAYKLFPSGQFITAEAQSIEGKWTNMRCTGVNRQIHGHIGHLNGRNANALEFLMDEIIEAGKRDPDFRFIDEVMRP